MSDGFHDIGSCSRASLLSVEARRAYREAGILVPAGVDPGTGYQRHHATQLTDAAVIRRLRDLDLDCFPTEITRPLAADTQTKEPSP